MTYPTFSYQTGHCHASSFLCSLSGVALCYVRGNRWKVHVWLRLRASLLWLKTGDILWHCVSIIWAVSIHGVQHVKLSPATPECLSRPVATWFNVWCVWKSGSVEQELIEKWWSLFAVSVLQVIDTSSCLRVEVLDDEATSSSSHGTTVLNVVADSMYHRCWYIDTGVHCLQALYASACTWNGIPLFTRKHFALSSRTVAVWVSLCELLNYVLWLFCKCSKDAQI